MTRGPKQSPQVTEALRLVKEEGLTQYAAAKRTGISRSTLSKNKEYQRYITLKKAIP